MEQDHKKQEQDPRRWVPYWAFTPVVFLAMGVGYLMYAVRGGTQSTPSHPASAQQAPSRAWTREDSLIAKILRENPRELCTQRGQYFLTPLAQSTLQSAELRHRYFIKGSPERGIHILITDEEIFGEAATLGEDNVLTSEEIVASYKSLTNGLDIIDFEPPSRMEH